MTDRSHEIPQDLRILVRVVSACIRPLGICSRFADRGLSVFVIEGLPVRSNFLARPAEECLRRDARNATAGDGLKWLLLVKRGQAQQKAAGIVALQLAGFEN
jgi:hypothetical protein